MSELRHCALTLHYGLVDGVHDIDDVIFAPMFRDGTITPLIREFFSGYSMVLSYIHDPQEYVKRAIGGNGAKLWMSGMPGINLHPELHAAECLLRPLTAHAITTYAPATLLPTTASWRERDYIGIHVGGGNSANVMQTENWLEIVQILADDNKLVVFSGPNDGKHTSSLINRLNGSKYILIQNMPLTSVAERLASCRAYIGHDSGFTHLVSCINIPSLVFWGPANLTSWRPMGSSVEIHYIRQLPQPQPKAAAAVVKQWLNTL